MNAHVSKVRQSSAVHSCSFSKQVPKLGAIFILMGTLWEINGYFCAFRHNFPFFIVTIVGFEVMGL